MFSRQFAYNEASFFLIRLLQQFTDFDLDEGEMLSPPDYWKTYEGREKDEKVYLSSHVTMSVKVGRVQFEAASNIPDDTRNV